MTRHISQIGWASYYPIEHTTNKLQLNMFRVLPEAWFNKKIMPFAEFKRTVMRGQHDKLMRYDVVVPPYIAVDLW
jgi:hypothetical protein